MSKARTHPLPVEEGRDIVIEFKQVGMTVRTIATQTGLTPCQVRYRLKAAGFCRTKADMYGYSRACRAALKRCARQLRLLKRTLANL